MSSQSHKQKLVTAADADLDMQMIKKFIHEGWPKYAHNLQKSLKPYYGFKDELSESDGIIFRGNQIVIPSSLRSYTRGRLHTSHLGTDSNLRRAKTLCFWPGMKSELQQSYDNCRPCQEYAKRNQKEPFVERKFLDIHFKKLPLIWQPTVVRSISSV